MHCTEDVNECEIDTHLCENDATCVVSQNGIMLPQSNLLSVSRTMLEAIPATAPCTLDHSAQKMLMSVQQMVSAVMGAHAL